MTFQLIYYSQQDPKWKEDILGFGDPGDTIGYVGCALTSTAMLLSGHGYPENPKTLNQKLKNVGGFVSAGIRWNAVSQIYPQVNVKSNISCLNADAPLGLIDASIAAGQPVIVMVDSTPAAGLLTHWVVLYAKEGSDYLMLDPWPYQTDVAKKTYLMPRYSQGNPLQRSIMHVIIYESFNASGGIAQPGSTPATGTPQAQPPAAPVSTGTGTARVKADVTWGLNIRSSLDTSSMANVVVSVPAGSILTLLEADGLSKIGAINQWVRVRDSQGHEGYAAAWYLEKTQTAAPAPAAGPVTSPATEAPASPSTPASTPASTPSTPATPQVTTPPEKPKLTVVVKTGGAKVYQTASAKSAVLSTEKSGARLSVVEAADKAASKIGVAGKWLTVKGSNGKRGYVDGGSVKK
ncbi:MAG: SH3 domain-containing protein [Chloroflexi bacterium]|nr:SH3 domain-containing protein [Chloroflexota bacterium]